MGRAFTTETQRHREILFIQDNTRRTEKKFPRLTSAISMFAVRKKTFCLSLCLCVSVVNAFLVNAFLASGRDVRRGWQPCS